MENESAKMNTKTHRRLRKAYCRLLSEADKEKINVRTLTDEADVSRATFYLYYQNIDEFIEQSTAYILKKFIKQTYIFLHAHRSEVKEACKRKNLFFTEEDFELFRCLFSDNRGFGLDENLLRLVFNSLANDIRKYFSDSFIKKNKTQFELFFIGYIAVMRLNFLDYHSDKAARDVLRSMDVWDRLFPEHPFKN